MKSEREKTGIKGLKVGFNKVFGYFIEGTKSNLSQVTDRFIRNLVEKNFSKLDFLWLPSTLLENYMELGKDTGFSLKFKNKFK